MSTHNDVLLSYICLQADQVFMSVVVLRDIMFPTEALNGMATCRAAESVGWKCMIPHELSVVGMFAVLLSAQ